jgi:hypothetical protein
MPQQPNLKHLPTIKERLSILVEWSYPTQITTKLFHPKTIRPSLRTPNLHR